jgi:hypothetical protein
MKVDPARVNRKQIVFRDDDSLVAEVIDNTTLVEEHCVSFTMVLMKNLKKLTELGETQSQNT